MKNYVSVLALFVMLVSGCTGQGIWVSTPTPAPQTSSEIASVEFEEFDHDLNRTNQWNTTYDEESGEVVILGTIEGGSNCHDRFLKNATYNEEDKTLHVSVVIVDKQRVLMGAMQVSSDSDIEQKLSFGTVLWRRSISTTLTEGDWTKKQLFLFLPSSPLFLLPPDP
jgi:hypothetical protein